MSQLSRAGVTWRRSLGALGLVAALGLAMALSGCTIVGIGGTTGSGVLKTETRNVSGFTKIVFSGVGTLNITQTGAESLKVSADDNILPLLTSTVNNGTLTLGIKPGYVVTPNKSITFTLTVKQLDGVTLSGAGQINAKDITVSALSVTISGAGRMVINGSAHSQTALVSGVGSYEAKDFKTNTAQVTISGTGSATVYASQTLDATVSGAGSVTYYGSPQVTKTVSGVGSIKQGQ